MGKKRMIDTDFWSDPWVVDNLNPMDRYLFIYLFTNYHTTIAGVYELSLKFMGFETGFERDLLINMLKRLEPKVYYKDGWVILRNGIKNQAYKSPKIKTGIEIALSTVPPHILQHVDWPKDFGSPKPEGSKQTQLLDTLSIPHDTVSHSIRSNIIKYNSNTIADKPQGLNKKTYAKAVRADEDLAIKESHARTRPAEGSGYSSARKVIDDIKAKRDKK